MNGDRSTSSHQVNGETALSITHNLSNYGVTLDTLPFDVLFQIFRCCDNGTLRRLSEISRRMRACINYYNQMVQVSGDNRNTSS